MVLLVLMLEIVLLVEVRTRIRQLGAVHLILAYLVVSQVVFLNAAALGYDEMQVGPMSSYLYRTREGIYLYFAIFLLYYLSCLGIRQGQTIDLRRALRENIGKLSRYQPLVYGAVMLFVLMDILALDLNAVWWNQSYLYINSPDGLAIDNDLTRFVHRIAVFVFMVAALLFFVNVFGLSAAWAVAWAFPALWGILFMVAASSRMSGVLLFAGAVIAYVLLRRGRHVVSLGLVALSCIAMMAALAGRGAGSFGLSAVPGMLASALGGEVALSSYVLNLFQGIFITNDSLMLVAAFPESYKLLSFSPLPAFIDGFDAIREAQEIRLHRYIPMSAVAEAIHFGYAYTALFFGAFAVTLRIATKLATRNELFHLFSTPYLFWIFVMANAYPVRNGFRQLLLVLVAALVAAAFARRKRPRRVAHRQFGGSVAATRGGR